MSASSKQSSLLSVTASTPVRSIRYDMQVFTLQSKMADSQLILPHAITN